MFKYKTKAEIDALTDAQLEAYMAEKKAHEDGLRAKEIEDAKAEVKAQAEAEIKKQVDAAKAELQTKLDDTAQQLADLKEQGNKGAAETKGTIVKFFEENIKDRAKEIEKATYAGHTEIKSAQLIQHGRSATKVAALMTTADVLPNVAGGFSPLLGNYIDTEIGHVPLPKMIFLGLVSVKSAPGTETIWWTDMVNEQGDAAFLDEGELKPLVSAQWQTYSNQTKEVAERWKQSKRLALHAPSVIADFAERANMYIEQKIDGAILANTSSTKGFDGLTDVGVPFIVPSTLANYYTYANIFDVIMACASQIMQANFTGEITAVLNTVWMAKMQGVKDSLGNYIIPPFVTKDGQNVGPVKVEFSNKVDSGQIIVGILSKYNLVIAENIMYDEGYENDDFSKNLMSKKLEAFMGSYIKGSDSGSIIVDDIATILTAIEVPVV